MCEQNINHFIVDSLSKMVATVLRMFTCCVVKVTVPVFKDHQVAAHKHTASVSVTGNHASNHTVTAGLVIKVYSLYQLILLKF